LLALLLAAAAAALRLGRHQSFARSLLAGALIGFSAWVAWEMAGLFGVTRALSPSVAPYLPGAAALLLALGLGLSAVRLGIAERRPGIRLTQFSR
jgi:lipopolysaccharide export LptBFGC system permease protein LptF